MQIKRSWLKPWMGLLCYVLMQELHSHNVSIPSNRALFLCNCSYSLILILGGLGEFETVMHNFQEFSQLSECLDEAT